MTIMEKTVRDKPTKMDEYAFKELIYAIKMNPFLTDSFFDFFAAMNYLIKCFHESIRGGPQYVTTFVYHLRSMFYEELNKRIRDEKNKWDERERDHFETGDEEFDAFRRMVLNHDWYADFSDDSAVWHSAERRWHQIQEIVKAKEGIYRTFLDLRTKRHKESFK